MFLQVEGGERAAEVLVTSLMGPDHKVGEMTDVTMAAEAVFVGTHQDICGVPRPPGGPVSALSPSRVMSRSINASVSLPIKLIEGCGKGELSSCWQALGAAPGFQETLRDKQVSMLSCVSGFSRTRVCSSRPGSS